MLGSLANPRLFYVGVAFWGGALLCAKDMAIQVIHCWATSNMLDDTEARPNADALADARKQFTHVSEIRKTLVDCLTNADGDVPTPVADLVLNYAFEWDGSTERPPIEPEEPAAEHLVLDVREPVPEHSAPALPGQVGGKPSDDVTEG